MERLNFRKLLRSKTTLAVLVLVVGFLSFSFTNLLLRHLRLSKELRTLNAQAETLSQESFKTKALIDQLSSRSFNEQEARLKLNLAAPNEQVAVIVGQPTTRPAATINSSISHLHQWWNYFFGDKSR